MLMPSHEKAKNIMKTGSFYQGHLESVSRSFGFCIAELSLPERDWVSLAYLLCRVVDTVEDSHWPNQEAQFFAFQQLKGFLSTPPTDEQFKAWFLCFPQALKPGERDLVLDLPLLLVFLSKLPQEIQKSLVRMVGHMIDGMMYFLRHHKKNNTLVLHSLMLTNQYCFFAAGIVGEFLSRLFTYSIPEFKLTNDLLTQSFHFGFFLQKINILKDCVEDAIAGRCFLSSYISVRDSLVVNAYGALDYLHSIPIVAGRRYRLFCAWSLFIGLASLKWMDKRERQSKAFCLKKTNQPDDLNILEQPNLGSSYKLGNRETYRIIGQISKLIDDNAALAVLFKRYLPEGNQISHDSRGKFEQYLPEWFTAIYQDSLANVSIETLGIVNIPICDFAENDR